MKKIIKKQKLNINEIISKTVAAVHTHTHTHTDTSMDKKQNTLNLKILLKQEQEVVTQMKNQKMENILSL